MSLKLLPLLAGVTVGLVAGAARAEFNTVNAEADTYVRRDNSGPYGSASELPMKNRDSDGTTRKALVRFRLPPAAVPADPYEASLAFDVSSFSGGSAATFIVFGIRNPSGVDCGATFDEATTKYKTGGLGYLDDSSNGVKESHTCVFGNGELGRFVVTSAQTGQTVRFQSDKLLAYLRSNTANGDGVVTFLVTRVEKTNDLATAFASKEHPTLAPPRLSWTSADDLDIVGEVSPPGETGTRQVTGAIRLPFGSGRELTIPGVSAEATYQNGKLVSLSGVAGMPELPTGAIFDRLGFNPLGAGTPSLSLGYATPEAFDLDVLSFPLPLDPSRKYFYLVLDTGLTVEFFGLLSFSPPFGTTTVLAIDPGTATVFVSVALPEPGEGNSSASTPPGLVMVPTQLSVGFSNDDRLEFRPLTNEGMDDYLTSFWGDLYLAADFQLAGAQSPDGSVGVGVSLSGEVVVNYDASQLASSNPTDALRDLGVNGIGTVAIDFAGKAELAIPIGHATATVNRASNGVPRLAFQGKLLSRDEALEASPELASSLDKLPFDATQHLPFGFGEGSIASGFVDPNNPLQSFLRFEGDLLPGFPAAGFSLKGSALLSPSQVAFSGNATFPLGSLTVSGSATASALTVRAQTSMNAKQGEWKVAFDLEPEITLTRNALSGSLDASAKACFEYPNPTWNNPDRISTKCVSTGTSLKNFDVSTGQVRVCVPGVSSGIPGIPALQPLCKNLFEHSR